MWPFRPSRAQRMLDALDRNATVALHVFRAAPLGPYDQPSAYYQAQAEYRAAEAALTVARREFFR